MQDVVCDKGNLLCCSNIQNLSVKSYCLHWLLQRSLWEKERWACTCYIKRLVWLAEEEILSELSQTNIASWKISMVSPDLQTGH